MLASFISPNLSLSRWQRHPHCNGARARWCVEHFVAWSKVPLDILSYIPMMWWWSLSARQRSSSGHASIFLMFLIDASSPRRCSTIVDDFLFRSRSITMMEKSMKISATACDAMFSMQRKRSRWPPTDSFLSSQRNIRKPMYTLWWHLDISPWKEWTIKQRKQSSWREINTRVTKKTFRSTHGRMIDIYRCILNKSVKLERCSLSLYPNELILFVYQWQRKLTKTQTFDASIVTSKDLGVLFSVKE